mgnify:CR=1 FL=1
MSTTDTPSSHVKTLEAIVEAEEKLVAKLFDTLPDKTTAAMSDGWDKLLGAIDARLSSDDISELAGGVRTIVEDVVEGQYDNARSSIDSLIRTEADHVSAHLGNLIQSIAQFTGGSNGVLSSLLQHMEANGPCNLPEHLAAVIGNKPNAM